MVKLGIYQIVVNPIHKRIINSISDEQKSEIIENIDKLANILNGNLDWVLSGGLAIAGTIGKVYRTHNDIDLGLNENYLENLVKNTRAYGYELFTRLFMTKLSSDYKLDIYKLTNSDEAIKRKLKNLRLVKINQSGRIISHSHILDYFDLYIHKNENGNLISMEEGLIVPESYNKGEVYTTISGIKIVLRNLKYIKEIKKKSKDSVDIFDLRILENYISE